MHPTSHFKTRLSDLRTTLELPTLVADLRLQAQLLDQGIYDEEQRTGIYDISNVAYPILAQSLRARRDNLLATIRMLEGLLSETDVAA